MGVLRIPRQDNQEGFVLVHIVPLAQKASAALDVKILATEGSAPFALTLKQNQIQKLKSKKAPCTDDEWEAILEVILLQQESNPEKAAVAEGIEVEATIEEDVAVELVFKKSTSGITQRLGSLRLTHDEDQEIELFDWCGASIQHSHSLTRTLKSAQSALVKEQAKSRKLAEQLEDLLKAKGENEHVLLEKFALLLNEKKAKIRELQGGRGVGEVEMPSRHKKEEEEHVVEEKAGKSRRGKRKAETVEPEEPEEMDVDEEQGKEEGATRDTSDEQETEDEDEEPVAAKRGGGRGGKVEAEAMDEDGSATESEDDGL
ncbi:hypothetical protein V499_01899 [Pseudogymnoascus sp. VKM F-103]|uniref:XRCC4 coiled-coil domain-containing protein n=1 Tax=Pseudogymnoascus verrucosus TaxID=342668 RepID=A0A1B8GR76_9PEZI|nr:uncharacterized protein VE01_03075 [Pseudogymnoascus verrucosus]KFY79059.1 hypothetical protein V499_01899 [Pseudogymnoascus sp. VKM F-103]OBT98328.1 hypothetical protein VE01_03075 [Pseudogymnoascus verrucosus]